MFGFPDFDNVLLLNWNKIIKWIRELSLREGREVGTKHYFNLIPLKYFIESASDAYKQWQIYRLKILGLDVLLTFHLNIYELIIVWTLSALERWLKWWDNSNWPILFV